MKTFETVLKHLESLGFKENQRRFNSRQLMLILFVIMGILSVSVSLFYAADTPGEYINGIFSIITSVIVLISYTSTTLETATIFIFINQFNKIIIQSELNLNY